MCVCACVCVCVCVNVLKLNTDTSGFDKDLWLLNKYNFHKTTTTTN